MKGDQRALELDALVNLIVNSAEIIKQTLITHGDPPLTLKSPVQHPIHNRHDEIRVVTALKALSASAQMLRALCDPKTYLNDIMYGADIANQLGEEKTLTSKELAKGTDIDPDKLSRYMRNLCNVHIFEEVAPDQFTNNALSAGFMLETKKALVGHCKAWEALTMPDYKSSTAPNRTPFNLAYGTDLPIFQYLSDVRPDIGHRAKLAMAGKSLNVKQYLNVYPWQREGQARIVDVGGGVGGATLPVVRAFPDLKLLVQDLPDSHKKFHENLPREFPDLVASAESGRIVFEGHDFFKPQTVTEADIYFLRHVIHDWPDAEAVSILKNLADAMNTSSKVLICEHVVFPTYRVDTGESPAEPKAMASQNGTSTPNGTNSSDKTTAVHSEEGQTIEVAPEPLLANWGAAPTSRLDLQVLTCLNAKQRTELEYKALARRAGLKVVKVWRNIGDEAIIECKLAIE